MTLKPLVTVVVPTIAPRAGLLTEALASIKAQTFTRYRVIVQEDAEHRGAPATRHAGLMRVRTPWVAFLDDDDLLMPQHLERLVGHARETGADYVYSWFETLPGGCDPFPTTHFTEPWDKANPRQTTITTMVRTDLAQGVGFLGATGADTGDGMRSGEDWEFTLGCNERGKISHLAERTWYWRHWGYGQPGVAGNTSGRGDRW